MYNKVAILFAFSVYSCLLGASQASSSSSTEKSKPFFDTILGTISLYAVQLFYNGSKYKGQNVDTVMLNQKLKPTDILAKVLVTSKDDPHASNPYESKWKRDSFSAIAIGKSTDWYNHGHPILDRFPEYLPIFLLEDKREGDTLHLVVTNKMGTTYKVELTCQQRSKYSKDTFEQVLADNKKLPMNFYTHDRQLLTEAGIQCAH